MQKHSERFLHTCTFTTCPWIHGRPQEFSQREAKPRGVAKIDYFLTSWRPKRKFSGYNRRFRLNLRVFNASAEVENFRALCTKTAYDVIIFKFQGRQLSQVAPLRAPMHELGRSRSHFLIVFPYHIWWNTVFWNDMEKSYNFYNIRHHAAL